MRLCIVAVLALLLPPVASAGSAERAADEAALREIKTVWWPRAYFSQDPALLDRILADEFQFVDGDGQWTTKADEMAWVAKHKPAYDSLVFDIRRLDIFENGTAVVAGTGVIRGRDANGPYVVEYQSTNIFIKRQGSWRAVASHVSGSKRK